MIYCPLMKSQHSEFIDHYQEWKHKVFSFFLYRLGGKREVAEDLTSETFIKAYEHFEGYDPAYAFSTWVFTIARNTLIDHFRKEKQVLPLELMPDESDESFAEEQMQRDADGSFQKEKLLVALSSLPDVQQECITLKYLNQMSTKEISKIVHTSEANVRQTLSRGIKKLKIYFQACIVLFLFFFHILS